MVLFTCVETTPTQLTRPCVCVCNDILAFCCHACVNNAFIISLDIHSQRIKMAGQRNHNKQQVLKISQYDYLHFFFCAQLFAFFFFHNFFRPVVPVWRCEFLMKLCVYRVRRSVNNAHLSVANIGTGIWATHISGELLVRNWSAYEYLSDLGSLRCCWRVNGAGKCYLRQ